jgi:D-Tyr-tRNAtyr deacylase
MKGPEAKVLYSHVLDELGKGLPGGKEKVKGRKPTTAAANYVDGVFGAMMQVDISNDVCSIMTQLTHSGPCHNRTRHEEGRIVE